MGILVGPTVWQSAAAEENYVQTCTLGDAMGALGGFLICRNGGTAWIVASNTSEVSRTWSCRNDAIITATECTGVPASWFIPTCAQLSNPGYSCRTYWDSYSSTEYWSSTGVPTASTNAYIVNFTNGAFSGPRKTCTHCVRAFRCVTY